MFYFLIDSKILKKKKKNSIFVKNKKARKNEFLHEQIKINRKKNEIAKKQHYADQNYSFVFIFLLFFFFVNLKIVKM